MKLTQGEINRFSSRLNLCIPIFVFLVYTIPTLAVFVVVVARGNFWKEYFAGAWLVFGWGIAATYFGIFFLRIHLLARKLYTHSEK